MQRPLRPLRGAEGVAPTSVARPSDGAPRSRSHRPDAVRWHLERSRRLLTSHPELAALIGPDRRTAIAILALVALQLGVAVALADLPVPIVIAVAWTIGAVIAHALGVGIHELAHDLVFRRRWMNKALSIVANLPLGFPAAIDFREKHLAHHRFLGDPAGRDTQAPTAAQAWLTGTRPLGKLAWLTFGPVVFHAPQKTPRPRGERAWIALNVVSCVALWPIVYAWSPASFAYLFVSALIAFGPHPVGARRYGEHLASTSDQPTSSYYGPWNLVSFRVGYHVEHHDLPGVPWTRIARVRAIAKEMYEPLVTVDSWSRLLVRLVLDARYGVDRYVRRDFLARAPRTDPK